MPRTQGSIHHNVHLSRTGHQFVYAADGYLLADVGSFQRNAEEDAENAAHVVKCWNACEGVPHPEKIKEAVKRLEQLCDDIDEDRWADPGAQSACLRIRETLRLLKG